MLDVILDLESMGTDTTAAIVAIGACEFDLTTCEIGSTFYRAVHLATSVRRGLTMDASTVLFWLGQPKEAQTAIIWNTVSIEEALADFATWLPNPNEVRVWGKGPSFDNAILGHAYRACGMDQPWKFWNDRCVRTIIARHTQVAEPEREGTIHNAKDDAVHEARWLIKIKQELANAKTKTGA